MTDDGISLRAVAHPIAPWHKRLWFRYQLMRCRLFGHDYSISVIDSVDGLLRYTYDRCSRCSKHRPFSYIRLDIPHD